MMVRERRKRRCAAVSPPRQGLTLVHLSAQCKRFLWVRGCLGGVLGVFMAQVEGVFGRLGDVLSVRNGLSSAEVRTSVSPCPAVVGVPHDQPGEVRAHEVGHGRRRVLGAGRRRRRQRAEHYLQPLRLALRVRRVVRPGRPS